MPGAVIAGGDSHTCTYGALGAFGTGLGSTDIASCLALGSFWQAVPETIQIELSGRTGSFVTGKDVILAVLAQIGVGGGTNAVLEFVGPGAEALSVDERLAVANMAVEAGSETGIFPADDAVAAYLEGRARSSWTAERSDPDATFRQRLEIDLSALEPLVALPHLPGNVKPVSEVGPVAGRPGLHRQLRERDDDRPAAGGVDPRRPQRSSADAGDHRSRDAGDLARGRGRGPARPVRRGGRDRLDPDLRRVLRRLERHPRRGRERRRDDEPQLPRPHGLARGGRVPRERVGRRRRGRRRRARPPGGDHDESRGRRARRRRRQRRHGRHVPRRVPQRRGSRPDGAVPLRGLRPDPARAARRGDDPRRRLELRHRLVARARPAGDEGKRDPRRRRPELRAHLLPQLRQPRPRDRRLPGGGRRRARRVADRDRHDGSGRGRRRHVRRARRTAARARGRSRRRPRRLDGVADLPRRSRASTPENALPERRFR